MKIDPSAKVCLTRDFFVRLANTPAPVKVKRLVTGFYSEYQPLNWTRILTARIRENPRPFWTYAHMWETGLLQSLYPVDPPMARTRNL